MTRYLPRLLLVALLGAATPGSALIPKVGR